MRKVKQFLVWLIAVAMFVGMLPLNVRAEGIIGDSTDDTVYSGETDNAMPAYYASSASDDYSAANFYNMDLSKITNSVILKDKITENPYVSFDTNNTKPLKTLIMQSDSAIIGTGDGNHMAFVVGWNDNYPANLFKDSVLAGDGAWLVCDKSDENNLYLTDDISTYYWISFYDESISDKAYASLGLADNISANELTSENSETTSASEETPATENETSASEETPATENETSVSEETPEAESETSESEEISSEEAPVEDTSDEDASVKDSSDEETVNDTENTTEEEPDITENTTETETTETNSTEEATETFDDASWTEETPDFDTVPSDIVVERLTLSQSEVSLYEGQSITLRCYTYPAGFMPAISWTSSDPSLVVVSANGLSTNGIADVTVVGTGIQGTETVEVKASIAGSSLETSCYIKLLKSEIEAGDELDENGKLIAVADEIWVSGFKSSFEYTGSKITQTLKVYDHQKLLTLNKDYTLEYKNNVNVMPAYETKAPSVTVKMKGQYSGSKTLYYGITAHSIASEDVYITSNGAAVTYNNKDQKYVPTITFNNKKLSSKSDFSIEYASDANLKGTADTVTTVNYTVKGKGNFEGERTDGTFYIVPASYNLNKASISMAKSLKYTGDSLTIDDLKIKLKFPGSSEQVSAAEFSDVTVTTTPSMSDIDGPCTVAVNIAATPGSAVCYGTVVKTLKVSAGYSLSSTACFDPEYLTDTFEKSIEYFYTDPSDPDDPGIIQSSSPTVITKGEEPDTLSEGTDYVVTYSNNRKVGTAKMTVKGIGAYSGSISKTYKITPATSFSDATSELTVAYTAGGAVPNIVIEDGGRILTRNVDYTVKAVNNKQITTAEIEEDKLPAYTVTGKGNYAKAEKITNNFTIVAGSLNNAKVVVADKVYSDKAGAYKSVPTLYDTNGKKLSAGKDYDKNFEYVYEPSANADGKEDTPKAGTKVNVVITGLGNYAESKAVGAYKIYESAKAASKLYVAIDTKPYTGQQVEVALSTAIDPTTQRGNGDVHVYLTSADLKKKTNEKPADEYFTIVSYTKNIKAGTAKVTLAGKGEYGGTKTCSFKITKKALLTIPVKSIILSANSLDLNRGTTYQLGYTVTPEDAEINNIRWTSSAEGVATVDSTGLITAVNPGTATIKVVMNNGKASATCSVKVKIDKDAGIASGQIIDVTSADVKTKFGLEPAKPNDNVRDDQEIKAIIRTVCEQDKDKPAAEKRIIYIPTGTYDIYTQDTGAHSIELTDPRYDYLCLLMDNGTLLKAMGNNNQHSHVIYLTGLKGVTIIGGKIEGERKRHTGSGGEWGMGIDIEQCSNISISDMEIYDCWGDGIRISDNPYAKGNNTNISITNCNIHHNRRNNISICGGDYVYITNCKIHHANGTDPQYGIDIETNNKNNPNEHIYIKNTEIYDNAKGALGIITAANDVVLTDCKLKGNLYNLAGKNVKLVRTTVDGIIDGPVTRTD